jgi:hypothetical protein
MRLCRYCRYYLSSKDVPMGVIVHRGHRSPLDVFVTKHIILNILCVQRMTQMSLSCILLTLPYRQSPTHYPDAEENSNLSRAPFRQAIIAAALKSNCLFIVIDSQPNFTCSTFLEAEALFPLILWQHEINNHPNVQKQVL